MQQCIYCGTEIAENLETCPSCGMSLVESHILKPGTIIGGKYEVVKKLGEGGFGITYIVKNTHISETEAMKELFIKSTCGRASTSKTNKNHVYSSQKSDFEYYKKKFLKEMGVLSKINHKNIVRMYNTVLENNTAYGVMEYINGLTLKQKIRAKGKFSEEEVLELLFSVGSGLKEVHDMDLTHRDIKPDNIMIDENGIYKIIDFGLVKEYQEASVTLSQVVSEGYSPKEQYRKKGKITPATDIYSLGMTIYSALTGELSPDNPTDRLDEDIEEEFQESINKLKISNKIKFILKKMIALKSKDRYQNFNEIFNELNGRGVSHTAEQQTFPAKPINYEDTTEDKAESNNGGSFSSDIKPEPNYEDTTEDNNKTIIDPKILDMNFVFVKGGTFQMGSNKGGNDEKPIHSVTIDDFYIGKYEVTQKEWKAVMDSNPSRFKGDNLPVECVSWNDVQEFLKKLNAKTIMKYRLPTEAEWEYAAKGGASTMLSNQYEYSGSDKIDDVAWYGANSGGRTHQVGTKQPNELGVYDMSGNIWEWCSDWYDSDYYFVSPSKNPQGSSSGSNHVDRGGSWNSNDSSCRAAYRLSNYPSSRYDFLGFRLVLAPN